MAILSKSDQLNLIKKPKNGNEIRKALRKKERNNLHAEPETETDYFTGPAHSRFLSWVRDILQNDENFQRFESLYRPPIPTNELVEAIFTEFEKVFEAQNSLERFEFTDPELAHDFTDYRKKIGDLSYWQTQGFETFKTGIDNVLVVDLPRAGSDVIPGENKYPEPYYYTLDLSQVIDLVNTRVKSYDAKGKEFIYFKTEYIIFKEHTPEGCFIYCFDDEKFTRYQEKEEGKEPVFIDDTPHDLGYCPARSFWTTPLNSSTTILKRGPITNSLSDLDWLLFFAIAERYLQLYAPFPIYAMYKSKCDYKEAAGARRRCVDGYLEVEGTRSLTHERERCPKCASKIKVGPGNILYFNTPKDAQSDPDLMANPMKVIPAETESLEYIRTTLTQLKQEIFSSCVGRNKAEGNEEAKNEMQINSGFESSESTLLKVKKNFEVIKLFALDTVARLRYGAEYLGGVVDLGDKFFNKDEAQEQEAYKKAVEAGLPAYELAIRRDELNETRYRNNPKMRERLTILRHLEPFPDQTLAAVMELRNKMPGVVSLADIVVKLNFGAFIDRFEREQASVNQFASATDFDKKIALIKEELNKYGLEYLAGISLEKAAEPPPAQPPVPDPAPVA